MVVAVTDDELDVCPECDAAGIRRCYPNKPTSHGADDSKFRCTRCGARFDTPETRPSRTSREPGVGGPHAELLSELDPSDIGGAG